MKTKFLLSLNRKEGGKGGREGEGEGKERRKKLGRITDKEASILIGFFFFFKVLVILSRNSTEAGMKKKRP